MNSAGSGTVLIKALSSAQSSDASLLVYELSLANNAFGKDQNMD